MFKFIKSLFTPKSEPENPTVEADFALVSDGIYQSPDGRRIVKIKKMKENDKVVLFTEYYDGPPVVVSADYFKRLYRPL